MTIHNEDPSMLPFYLNDETLKIELSHMAQLLHVVGQKETKAWKCLPKTTLDGRRVRKIGEEWTKNTGCIQENIIQLEQTSEHILPELILMKELNQLENVDSDNSTPIFIELIAAEIVTENYPKGLLKAWDSYFKESEKTRPDVHSSKDQTFVVLVSANGGVALEDFVLENEKEIFSILIQLAFSMLFAEVSMEFEHRDLHLGLETIRRVY